MLLRHDADEQQWTLLTIDIACRTARFDSWPGADREGRHEWAQATARFLVGNEDPKGGVIVLANAVRE